MKVKDLKGINPEAEIKIIFYDGSSYKGPITYGWSGNDGDVMGDSKKYAEEVCLFLGDISEKIN